MTELLIRYQDGSGDISERTISKIEVQDHNYILAYCHLREEDRTFKISRIVSAIDPNTGEVIEDLYHYFGVPAPVLRNNDPYGDKAEPSIPRGVAAIKRQRSKERNELFRRFVSPVIVDYTKRKFFRLFNDRCFKCGSPNFLVMDHHRPIVRGGHLAPGNLVALCWDCNIRKADFPPESFYSEEELNRLQPYLASQHDIFAFEFDSEKWKADRQGYLLSLGIDAGLVHDVLYDPNHRFYIAPAREPEGEDFVFTIDDETIKRITEEVMKQIRQERAK